MTPKVRIAAGIVLVLAGFVAGFTALFISPSSLRFLAYAVAWALTIGGLVVLLFRRSENPIGTGIALVLVSPLVLNLLLLFPIRTAFFLLVLPAVVIALYGVFLIVLGRAEKRREEPG